MKDKGNKDTEIYELNRDDGNNLIYNLEAKESKENNVPIRLIGYYKNNTLFEEVIEKSNLIKKLTIKKIKNKIRR